MKTLISGVGNRDPFSENDEEISEGAVITSIRYFQPDYIYLMPSADKRNSKSNTYNKALECEKEISKFSEAKVFIKPLNVNNVTDYIEIKKAFQNNLKEIYEDFANDEVEFINSISSGTAQMETIWLILKNNGFLKGNVYKVIAPRFAEKDEPALRVKKIVLDWFKEDNLIKSSNDLLTRFSFENVTKLMEELSEITTSPNRKVFADIFTDLFKGYALWDNLHYQLAIDKLNKVKRELQKFDKDEILEIVTNQVDFLKKITKSKNETSEVLLDLFFNLKRRFLQDNYADSLSRMWRIYEGFSFFLMRKNYGIEPLDLDKSKNKAFSEKLKKDLYLKSRNGIYSINREIIIFAIWKKDNSKEWKLLQQDAIFTSKSGSKQKKQLIDVLEHLRKLRNNSIIAHGLDPIHQEIGQQCLEISNKLLLLLDDINSDEINNYPFNLENIKKIASFLERLY